jgi:hypothetical protein
MFAFLATLFERNRRSTSQRSGRFCLEELESRAVPSATATQLTANIKIEMAAIKVDLQHLAIPIGSLTVRTDIANLAKDVRVINTDLAAGINPTTAVNTAIAADTKLNTDLGTRYSRFIHYNVQDIGNRLKIVANDLSQLHTSQGAVSPISAGPGIQGTAIVGPISPVTRPGVPNSQPLPGAVIEIETADGSSVVTTVTADQNGNFQVALAPGTYLLVPLPPKSGPAMYVEGFQQTVVVGPGPDMTNVTVQYDSGIAL